MKIFIAILILLVPMNCIAAIDHLSKTYQPLFHPPYNIQVLPVYFRTINSIPDTEIALICSPNKLGSEDANLASLYGFSIKVKKLKHRGSVTVAVDMTIVAKPDVLECTLTSTKVLEATVQCLTKLLKEHEHSVLHIIIVCPKDKLLPEWKEYEKSYDLSKAK